MGALTSSFDTSVTRETILINILRKTEHTSWYRPPSLVILKFTQAHNYSLQTITTPYIHTHTHTYTRTHHAVMIIILCCLVKQHIKPLMYTTTKTKVEGTYNAHTMQCTTDHENESMSVDTLNTIPHFLELDTCILITNKHTQTHNNSNNNNNN